MLTISSYEVQILSFHPCLPSRHSSKSGELGGGASTLAANHVSPAQFLVHAHLLPLPEMLGPIYLFDLGASLGINNYKDFFLGAASSFTSNPLSPIPGERPPHTAPLHVLYTQLDSGFWAFSILITIHSNAAIPTNDSLTLLMFVSLYPAAQGTLSFLSWHWYLSLLVRPLFPQWLSASFLPYRWPWWLASFSCFYCPANRYQYSLAWFRFVLFCGATSGCAWESLPSTVIGRLGWMYARWVPYLMLHYHSRNPLLNLELDQVDLSLKSSDSPKWICLML